MIIKRLGILAGVGGILISSSPLLYSQTKQNNVITQIEEESEGMISITVPDNLMPFLYKKDSAKKTASKPTGKGVEKTTGYRIQVFSDGRNPATLESRAKARGNAILAKFPKYRGQIYTHSSSPNWYTRVGNFKDSQDANEALAELKRAFPNFASEMRVVKSQIVLAK